MDPAHQRLDGEHRAVGGDDRLEERLDLATRERRPQLVEVLAALVDRIDRDAAGLRVGVAFDPHQLVARTDEQGLEALRSGFERSGGANADVDLLFVHDDRPGHVAPDAITQHLDGGRTRRADGEHELVATEAGRDQIGPSDLVDPTRDRRQHLVADRFAIEFVDRPELGDVDDHQAEAAALADQVVCRVHEAVTVEQPGAVVVLGQELDAVAGVRQRRGDLARDDVSPDRRVVGEVVDGELAHDEFARGGDEPGVEVHGLLLAQRGDGVEHRLTVVFVHEPDERPTGDEFGIVTEQAGDGTVDRADPAVGIDERHHAVHVREHRAHHRRLALVEFEPVPIRRVASDQHRDLTVVEALDRAADLQGDPHPGAAAHPHHDQLAGVLLADRRERRDRDVQVVGVDDIENRPADELLVGPSQHADGAFVGIAQGPVGIDRDDRIGEAVERWLGCGLIGAVHKGVSVACRPILSGRAGFLTESCTSTP